MKAKIRNLLIFTLLLVFNGLNGQSLSGVIQDISSKETLVGATILAPDYTYGTTTDPFGRFNIPGVSLGSKLRLQISYVGYEPVDTTVSVTNSLVVIALNSQSDLPEITVIAKSPFQELGKVDIPIKELNAIPALLGEQDPLKALVLTPGISNGAEGTAGLYVRGGTPDQNLILFDGAKVYNANHLFGLLSPFNPDLVKDLQVYKNYFPSRYGGRLSSVIDITSIEGDKTELKKTVSLGLINSRVSLQGPLIKDKLSFAVGGRTAHLALLNLLTAGDDNYTNYLFYDLNGKLNYRSDKLNISASAFHASDQLIEADNFLETPYRTVINWSNSTASLRMAYNLSNNLMLDGNLNFNRYHYGVDQQLFEEPNGVEISRVTNQAYVQEVVGKVGLSYQPARWARVSAGFELNDRTTKPKDTQVTDSGEATITVGESPEEKAEDLATFVSADVSLTDWLEIKAGFRYASYRLPDEASFNQFEPRLSAELMFSDKVRLQLAYNKMTQPLHLLTSNYIGVPSNIWVSARSSALPQVSRQFAVGISYQVTPSSRLSVETYYKESENLIDPLPGTNFYQSSITDWQEIAGTGGNGIAYGSELFYRFKKPSFYGWASYTLSWSKARFDGINNGEYFFRQFDRRHDISLTGGYKLNENWDILANFVYQTGYRQTLPLAIYQDPFFNSAEPVLIGRFNEKVPDYHRLDVSFRHTKKTSSRERTIALGVYNFYGRPNPFFVYSDPDEQLNSSGQVQQYQNDVKKLSLFNLIPSINYTIKW
ncbi:MAG: carboxypeptidase-like regulatory domain-containing protein [Lewinella sp.]